MHDIFSSLAKFFKPDLVSCDNAVFRLHHKGTVVVLVAVSLLLTQKQYFGDPIDCRPSDSSGLDSGLVDTYCWISSTYTLPSVANGMGAHQGVAQDFDIARGRKHDVRHHTYYQWVTLFLYFQALLFMVPHSLWKMWEGGKMEKLVSDLHFPITDVDVKKDKKDFLVSYFKDNLQNNNSYFYRYVFCEILNFINIIAQIFFTDFFLGHVFTTYGPRVLNMTEEEHVYRNDYMEEVFPVMSKCSFRTYGPSGSLQNFDALCVLPLNIFNQKAYVIIWFWFVFVCVASTLSLLYRVATFVIPVRQILLAQRARLAIAGDVLKVIHKCNSGDWFLLYYLAKNMDPVIFKEFMTQLASNI